MELRDIEIFLTLAEELHFGHTAERLHISQARVSQSIKKQERKIGAALFERTSRRVMLTSIGAQLYVDLKAAYGSLLNATEAATAAARGTSGSLTLGVFGPQAHQLAPLIGEFRSRHPATDLHFHEIRFSEPFTLLRAGEIDIQTCWLPVREPDLTAGPIVLTEPMVLMVAGTHPLAGLDSVSLEDLGDCTVPRITPEVPAYWEEALLPFRTPSGRPIERGPKVSTFQEALAAVASGEIACPAFADAPAYYQRPGIKYLPVRDAPSGQWALTWRSGGETALTREFIDIARKFGESG